MARIKVPQADGEITHFDGAVSTTYKVAGGEIAVDDAHVATLLASIPGSELQTEAPSKKEK